MRKLIGLALVSACAASESPAKPGVGSGSQELPVGSFALSTSGFIVQDTRWWSGTTGPKINGPVDAPSDGMLVAKIDGKQVGPAATIVGDAWSLQLPDGTILPTDTSITFELSAPDRQPADVEQVFVYDQGGPTITIDAKVIDENADAIDYSTGEPVHTHNGAPVDLSSGCPDLHMYAYLLDPNRTFGKEVSPNPLAFQVSAMSPVGAGGGGAQYRVRLDDGTVVIDWFQMPMTGLQLTREMLPQLGTRDGGLNVDFKMKDNFGHENIATACFKYHPLTAPIAFEPIRWETQNVPYLRDMIVNGSPVSSVLNSSAISAPQVGVVSQRFVQYSGEQVLLTMTFAPPSAQYAKTVSQRFLAGATGTFSCGDSQHGYSGDPHCKMAVYVTNTDTPTSGAVTNWEWQSIIVDDATGLPPSTCSTTGLLGSCTIPPRQLGQAPRAYRMITFVGGVRDLWPGANDPFGEYYLGNNHYFTGYAPQTIYKCTTMTTSNVFGVTYYACSYTTYTAALALGAAKLSFAPFQTAIKTSPGLTVGLTTPPSSPAFASPAYTWDGGAINF